MLRLTPRYLVSAVERCKLLEAEIGKTVDGASFRGKQSSVWYILILRCLLNIQMDMLSKQLGT